MNFRVEGPLECWIWQGATTSRGYPVARIAGKVHQVRRVLYERHKRPLLDGERIKMACKERLCVRPEHMEAVTPRSSL